MKNSKQEIGKESRPQAVIRLLSFLYFLVTLFFIMIFHACLQFSGCHGSGSLAAQGLQTNGEPGEHPENEDEKIQPRQGNERKRNARKYLALDGWLFPSFLVPVTRLLSFDSRTLCYPLGLEGHASLYLPRVNNDQSSVNP